MTCPKLSVVIPVYNDPAGIEETLASLTDQTYSSDQYEILVVDNDSTDRTRDVIASFEEEHPNLLTALCETDRQSSYAARNHGIDHASGEYIAFVDADMHVDPDWVESVVRKMETNDWQYMACNVEVYRPDETLVARFSSFSGFPIETFVKCRRFAPTCCLVVDATLFDTVGKFDERFVSGGDAEFGRRVHEAGISQQFASDVVMYHPTRTSLGAFISRHWRIGRGITQQKVLYPDRYGDQPPALWKLVLPPRPKNFRDTIRGSPFSYPDILLFYLFEYINKLSRAAGRIHEWFRLSLTRRYKVETGSRV